MAHAITQGAHARAPAAGFIARFKESLANYRVYRSTIRELSQLSDRELSDLGISRASIRDIARQSVYTA